MAPGVVPHRCSCAGRLTSPPPLHTPYSHTMKPLSAPGAIPEHTEAPGVVPDRCFCAGRQRISLPHHAPPIHPRSLRTWRDSGAHGNTGGVCITRPSHRCPSESRTARMLSSASRPPYRSTRPQRTCLRRLARSRRSTSSLTQRWSSRRSCSSSGARQARSLRTRMACPTARYRAGSAPRPTTI